MNRIARYRASITVVALATVLLFVYQNCSQGIEEKESPSFEAFAFEAKPDSIGYMSCSDMEGADPSTFFTFRVGAYRNGGMRLTDDFYQATSRMSTQQKMDFLANGARNRDIQMQLAIRQQTDMVAFASESNAKQGSDVVSILPPVNDPALSSHLVNLGPGEKLKEIPGSFSDSHRFEGTLSFLDSRVLEDSVRTELNRGAYLALTYHPLEKNSRTDSTLALAPGDFEEEANASDFNKAYGFGYNVTFAQGVAGGAHPARVMRSMNEVDLLTKKGTSSRWSCPADLRFKIVRQEDLGVVVDGERVVDCDRVVDPQNLGFKLELVRKVLRTEDWYVDMKNRCIVRKEGRAGLCYGPDTEVEYNSSECGGNVACAHFFSVCYAATSN